MSSYCSAWIPQQILKSNYNPFPNPPSQFYKTVAFVWRAFHCRRRRQQNTVLCKRDNHVHKFCSVSRSRRRWWRSQSSLAAAAKCVALACPSLLHTAVLCCVVTWKALGRCTYACINIVCFGPFALGNLRAVVPFGFVLATDGESFYGWRSGSRWASWMSTRREGGRTCQVPFEWDKDRSFVQLDIFYVNSLASGSERGVQLSM